MVFLLRYCPFQAPPIQALWIDKILQPNNAILPKTWCSGLHRKPLRIVVQNSIQGKSLATTEKTLNNNSNNNKNKTEDPLKIFPVIFNRPKQFFFHCTWFFGRAILISHPIGPMKNGRVTWSKYCFLFFTT